MSAEPHEYRRANLLVSGWRDPFPLQPGPIYPEQCADDEAQEFALFTIEPESVVEFFDTRTDAEEYLELIAR